MRDDSKRRELRVAPAEPTPFIRDKSELPKIATDVSFHMATVVAGLAVVIAVDRYFTSLPPNQVGTWPLFWQALAVILTTMRFFHGNVMWHYWALIGGFASYPSIRQRKVSKLTSYYVHIGQYVLFVFSAHAIGSPLLLVKTFTLISVIDVLWTLGNYWGEKDEVVCRALGSWCLINLACLLGMAGLWFAMGRGLDPNLSASLVGITYLASAVIDYIVNSRLFFGGNGQPAAREEVPRG
jgi:hypothetical protein